MPEPAKSKQEGVEALSQSEGGASPKGTKDSILRHVRDVLETIYEPEHPNAEEIIELMNRIDDELS